MNNSFKINFIADLNYLDLYNYSIQLKKIFSLQKENIICINSNDPFYVLSSIFATAFLNKQVAILSKEETPNGLKMLRAQLAENSFVELTNYPYDKNKIAPIEEIRQIDNALPHLQVILFSSGTSGFPKGILLNFSSIKSHIDLFSHFFKTSPHEKYLINLPLNHVSGLMIVFRAFFNKGTLTKEIENRPDYISLVPTQFIKHVNIPFDLELLKNAKAILIGGQNFQAKLLSFSTSNQLNVYTTYGMTETCSFIALNGQVLGPIKVKVDDDKIISINSPTLASGYYKNGIFEQIKLEHGFYKTADLGELTENKIEIYSRNDLIINSGGEKINPLEIESAIEGRLKLKNVFLTSIKDEKWGNMAILLYQSDDDLNPTIYSFLKENFHPYHLPKFIFKINSIPFAGIKVKRHELSTIAENEYLRTIFSHQYIDSKKIQTLVIFHGFMEDKTNFSFIPDLLGDQYNYLLIDLPGHGKTSTSHFYSTDDLFCKLRKLIETYQDQNDLFLFGYSMGGRVAMNLALFYNLSIKKLFLISSGVGEINLEEKNKRKMIDENLFSNITSKEDFKTFLDQWYRNPIFHNFNQGPEYQSIIDKKLKNNSILELKKSLTLMSPSLYPLQNEYMEKLKKSNFHITYLVGLNDQKYSLIAKALDELKNPYIKVLYLENEGHNPHIYSQKLVIELLFSNT